jgi:ABC-type oligopeptide transport system substrate-binding subunit
MEGIKPLRTTDRGQPPPLDVNTATDTTSHLILRQLMDSLYEYDGEGKIPPTGAVSY